MWNSPCVCDGATLLAQIIQVIFSRTTWVQSRPAFPPRTRAISLGSVEQQLSILREPLVARDAHTHLVLRSTYTTHGRRWLSSHSSDRKFDCQFGHRKILHASSALYLSPSSQPYFPLCLLATTFASVCHCFQHVSIRMSLLPTGASWSAGLWLLKTLSRKPVPLQFVRWQIIPSITSMWRLRSFSSRCFDSKE